VFDITLTSEMIVGILPELLLVLLAEIILIVDLSLPFVRKRNLGWVAFGGLVFIAAVTLFVGRPGTESVALWGGMMRFDWMSYVFKLIFLFGAAVTVLFSMDDERLGQRGEYYMLLIASTLGMCLMAAASDLIFLYLAIETTSIPLYILAGFLTRDAKSTEAGFKYLFFGAMTSAVMLYGFSLIFGFSGTTDLYALAQGVQAGGVSVGLLVGTLMLIMVGFGFKVSAFPFHFWAPDVYEGAPTPVAGFLSTASKAAGFAVLLRVLLVAFPVELVGEHWVTILSILAVLTMTVGNVLALAQRNIKRLLAFSSIAHAGYVLIGVVAVSSLGMTSVVFYMIVYMLTNLAAFGAVVAFWRMSGTDEISAYAGLSRRSPVLALVMLVAFLSLAGMPPLGGFIGKVLVFAAAVEAGMYWLAIVGILNSIVGLYYYLTVLKVIYLYRSDDDDKPILLPRPYAMALGVLTVGIVLVGSFFAPWFEWAQTAAFVLFP
jgi:NADH-quinone oxidoreductase subunit N